MLVPIKPANERARMSALQSLRILDTPPEERFDRLTRLARRLFDVPIALVSLVDDDRQWFKSCVGMAATETSRDASLCGHTILCDDIFVINDAQCDERFSDNPLVTGAPHIRFYAGCPLRVADGSKIGTLCLIDVNPRELDHEDHDLMRDLTKMVEEELAAIQLATTDDLTLLSNRRGFESLAQHALNICKRTEIPASLLFFDLNGFKKINDQYGHAEGDWALQSFADVLRNQLRESDVIGRLGGDEFAVLLTDLAGPGTGEIVTRLRQTLNTHNNRECRGYQIQFCVGQIDYNIDQHTSIACLLSEADAAMYANKWALTTVPEHTELIKNNPHAVPLRVSSGRSTGLARAGFSAQGD